MITALLTQLLGTWTASTGEVTAVPCPPPAAFGDEALTIRLPAGCPVLKQRIGYPVQVDLSLRAELPALRAELVRSREAADAIIAQARAELEAEQKAHRESQERLVQADAVLQQERVTSSRYLGAAVGLAAACVIFALASAL